MFRLILVLITVQFLFMTPITARAENTANGGTMHFYGAVINASCTIDAQSLKQNVEMDQVRTASFSGPGSWASPKTFTIKLDSCDTSTSQFASVAFSGATDPVDPQVFKVGFGSGAAKGVGIGIFDSRGTLLIPNTTPVSKSALNEKQTILFFTAKYRSVSTQVIPGDASTAINFSVIYQ